MITITATLDLDVLNDRADLFTLACLPDAEAWWEGELEVEGEAGWDAGDRWTPPGGEAIPHRLTLDGLEVTLEWLDVLDLWDLAEELLMEAAADAARELAWGFEEVA